MSKSINRREFINGAIKAGAFAGLGYSFNGLTPAFAAQAKAAAGKVQFSPDVRPLVSLIEDTSRDRLLSAMADRVRKGVGYQEILAALFLAGVRDIEPRPVGFKFHAVMVVNSMHLSTMAAADKDRWLPLFWALDNFKEAQATNKEEGGWYMKPPREGKLPTEAQAKESFTKAMDNWDVEASDEAITELVRTSGAGDIIEMFWRFGARDFRDIGHKAIYTANAWRTMQLIGWRYAEPVMRSLAYALLAYEGENPAKGNDEADLPWRENLQRAGRIRTGWQQGKSERSAVIDLLSTLRQASTADTCENVVKILNNAIDPASVWDALFLRAGELLMQQPGILGVHCVTSMNALHFGYQASGNDETRRMLVLQAAAFLCEFRKMMAEGGKLNGMRIDTLEKEALNHQGTGAVEEIFADVTKRPLHAARKTIAFLDAGGDPRAVIAEARRLIAIKGSDAHAYKFSSAALEDFYNVSPDWRNRYLATSMFNLCGTGERDSEVALRTRAIMSSHPAINAR